MISAEEFITNQAPEKHAFTREISNKSNIPKPKTFNYSSFPKKIREFIDNNAVSIYPNPTSNEAKLSLGSISDVLVYNILGKEVLKVIDFKGELILSKNDLGKGMFYIIITSKNKIETIKLIIK
jgi:hypothetical protein